MTKRLEKNAILLLGSEPVVRSVMTEALQHAGYVVMSTGSLGTAVDYRAKREGFSYFLRRFQGTRR